MIDHFVGTMSIAIGLEKEKETARDNRKPIAREDSIKLYEGIEAQLQKAFVQFRYKRRAHSFMLLPSLYAVRILYFVRNYLVDGVFPFMLAALALAAIFQLIDLHWLRAWIPTPRMP